MTTSFHGLPTAGAVALAFGVLSFAALADGTTHVSAPLVEAVHLDGTVEIDCSNSPGPRVTLSGVLALADIDLKAIFRNNVKGTHEYTDEFSVTGVLLADEDITIPKQPPLGGAGGNPFVWLQFLDGDGNPLSGEIYLGRCVQGLTLVDLDTSFFLNAIAAGDVTFTCTNHQGPFITFDGGLTISGLTARFIFRNNDNPVHGPHDAVVTTDLTLISDGTVIVFPKQPPLGGAGGNPLMYLQFLDGDGNPLSGEIALGRCVQSKKKK